MWGEFVQFINKLELNPAVSYSQDKRIVGNLVYYYFFILFNKNFGIAS